MIYPSRQPDKRRHRADSAAGCPSVQIADARNAFVSEQQRGRRQSSLEFISATMERRAALQNAIPMGNDPEGVVRLLEQLSSESGTSDRRRDLNRFLSYYEAVGVGVNTGVFDIEIIDRAWGSVIIRTFAAYREYICERRSARRQPLLFSEFEELAECIARRRGENIVDHVGPAARPVSRV